MARKQLGIDVIAKAAAAAKNFDEFKASIDRSRKAVEDTNKSLGSFDQAVRKSSKSLDIEKKATSDSAFSFGALKGKIALASGAVAAFGFATVAAARKVQELSRESLNIQNAYANLAFSIEQARQATGGFIGDSKLAVLANQAASLGVATTAKSFAELAHAAQVLGARMGKDVTETLESMIGAIGRGSTALLDNFGVSLKEVQRIQEELAESTGKSTAALSTAENQQLRQQAVMKAITEAAKTATVETEGFAASIVKLGVEWENFRDRVITGGASHKGKPIQEALADMTVEQIHRIKELRDEIKTHGAAREELNSILRESNVEYENLNELWSQLVVFQTQGGLVEKERAAAEAAKRAAQEQANAEQLVWQKDILMFLERELAMAEAQQEDARTLLSLKRQIKDTEADILELQGKSTEAEQKRFEASVVAATKVRSGKRGKSIEDLIKGGGALGGSDPGAIGFSNQQENELLLSLGQPDLGTADPFSQESLDARRQFLEQKNELELEMALQGIAQRSDAGILDPIAALGMERDAQLEHLSFLEETANTKLERDAIGLEKERVMHDARMAIVQEQIKAEESRRAAFMATTDAVSTAAKLQTNTFAILAETVSSSEQQKTRIMATAVVIESAIQAALEQARAIAAFASFNIPQGLAHEAAFAAYVVAGIQAGKQAFGGAGGAGGGRGKASRQRGQFGTTPNRVPVQSGGGAAGNQSNAGPVFPRSPGAAANAPQASGPTNVFNIDARSLGKVDTDELALKVGRALKKAETGTGRF